MAFVIPFIPYIIAAVGVVGAIAAGQTAKANAQRDAGILDDQANNAEAVGDANAASRERQLRRQIGAAQASAGASGLSLGGSVLDVLNDITLEGEQDIANTRYGGTVQAVNLRNTAAGVRAKGDQAVTQSYFNAAGAVGNAYALDRLYGKVQPTTLSDNATRNVSTRSNYVL